MNPAGIAPLWLKYQPTFARDLPVTSQWLIITSRATDDIFVNFHLKSKMLSIRNTLKLEDTDKTLFIRVFLVSTRSDIWRTRHLMKFLLQHGSVLPQSKSIDLTAEHCSQTEVLSLDVNDTPKFILALATCHPATSVSDLILFSTESHPPQPRAVLVFFTNQLFLQPRSVPSIIMHLIKASCSCDFRFNGWAERDECGWTPVDWKLSYYVLWNKPKCFLW